MQDVTRRRLAEDALDKARSELAHVSRVTTLNALTASIAHEVNQPLSGIITNAGTCLRMLDANPPNIEGARETARRTIRDGNRASEVVTRLRALFTRKEFTLEPLDLNEATREVIALAANDLQRNRIILHSELTDDPLHVAGDRIQLQQVILNLLRNASDAMVDVQDRPRELLVKTEPDDGHRVRLTVRDTGMGLPPETVGSPSMRSTPPRPEEWESDCSSAAPLSNGIRVTYGPRRTTGDEAPPLRLLFLTLRRPRERAVPDWSEHERASMSSGPIDSDESNVDRSSARPPARPANRRRRSRARLPHGPTRSPRPAPCNPGSSMHPELASKLKGPIGFEPGDRSSAGVAVVTTTEILADLNARSGRPQRIASSPEHEQPSWSMLCRVATARGDLPQARHDPLRHIPPRRPSRGRSGATERRLHACVDSPDEQIRWDETTPLFVVGRRWFCGQHLLLRAALTLQCRNLRTNLGQHVSKLAQLRPIAGRSMARNDDRRCHRLRKVSFRCPNHAVDASSGRTVNKGIHAVPPRVPDVMDIGFDEPNRNIRVGVCRIVGAELHRGAVEVKRSAFVEYIGWERARRRRRERECPVFHTSRRGQVLARIFVREDRSASGMQPLVAVGVIEMPMRIDQMSDRICAELGERLGDFPPRSRNARVHEQLALAPWQDPMFRPIR